MKTMKRILAFILAVMLFATCLPTQVFAEEEVTVPAETAPVEEVVEEPAEEPVLPEAVEETAPVVYAASGTCGENLTWTLDNAGTLTISGTGAMDNYGGDSSNAPWESNWASIKQVVIGDKVTTIGDLAFYDCYNLTAVSIGSKVTTIGLYAFRYCTGLTSVTIPDSVTTIGEIAFGGCSKLASVTFGDGLVTIGESAFASCTELESITIPDSVTYIDVNAFYNCTDLREIVFEGNAPKLSWDCFSNVTANAYYPAGNSTWKASVWENCGGFITWQSVTNGNAVASGTYGENLTWTLDNAGTLTISGVGGVEDCTSSSQIPWDDMRSSIKKVVYSEGVSSINFLECYDAVNLTDVYIPSTVVWIEANFVDRCYSLEGIWVAAENPYYYSDSNGVFFYKRDDGMLHLNRCPYTYSGTYSIPDNVVYISGLAFDNCNYLTGVSIPASVKTIDAHAFSGSGLQEITIPKTVEEIGGCAFSYCWDLTEINVDAKNPNYCSEDGVLFDGDKWTLLQCPAGREGVYYVPGDIGCIGRQSFAGCDKLTSVIIPENIRLVGTDVFQNCINLESFKVDPNNEYYCSDSNGVLFNKKKTELISYPFARQGAYTIPDGVATVWSSAFFNADGLTAVTVPSSVKELQQNAFGCCDNLNEIYFMGNAPAMEWFTFYEVKATAYYPANNATWTEEVMNSTVGDITWKTFAVKQGLIKENGIWKYYKNNVFQENFEGLVKYGNTYYYVNNGVLDNTYTGVVTKGSVTYYVQKGTLKWGKDGLVKCSNGDWYYVKDSRVQTGATTLVKYNGVWYYVENGKMDKSYTGIVTKGAVTYYVYKGTMKFDKNGLVKCSDGSWYYVKESRVQTNATTLVKYSGVWYYVERGWMDKNYTGVVDKGGVTYYVYKGTMKFNKNGLVKCGNGEWYYVKESRVQTNFTGIVEYSGALYYVQNGYLNKSFSGTITYNGQKYTVTKGTAKKYVKPATPVTVTIKKKDHSITKSGNRKLEAIFDLPVLSGGHSEGTATINEMLQNLYQVYLESLDFAEERLDSAFSGETFVYNMRCVVSYQSENLVCLKYSREDTVVGYDSELYAGLTFDLATGEILEMQDLFSMDEDDLLDQIKASISKYLKNNGLWDSNSQDVIDSYELYWFAFYINSKGELVVCIDQFELAYSALQIPCGVYVNK